MYKHCVLTMCMCARETGPQGTCCMLLRFFYLTTIHTFSLPVKEGERERTRGRVREIEKEGGGGEVGRGQYLSLYIINECSEMLH